MTTTTKPTLNNIERWSDKELSKQILTIEHVIRRSKERLKQLREEEHRRDNVRAYFNKDDMITQGLVHAGIIRKKRNNNDTDRAIKERQFTNSSIQGGNVI
ncbi:hypothetical protein DIGNKC_290 [Bacillus phage DIGNKC]|uniref:hypothetical protein n=1 Tax=Bacillus phage DIGNKC TaxID=1805948 RepID=UPI0007A773FE|nr:hypothetical protein BI007_gp084 [Bacillus phage DIGNKC]AMW62759.1 hypothetical protein DIGNKC_290 [Bacillus phage DIGNKC]